VSRKTVARRVELSGVGLHMGMACRLGFEPATAGTGVRFRRTDRPGSPDIPARVDHAVLAERRTQLGVGAEAIHTVEHVLAAVAAREIDDVVITMDGPEPPIMDGSAGPFFNALAEASIVDGPGRADVFRLLEPVRVTDGDSEYTAEPSDVFELDVEIDFPHPLIGLQRGRYRVTPSEFARELAGARTFGFVREVEALRAKGLIRGASTANAVVLDECDVLETTLRWPDEFVRHKAMDCVGDLALAGGRLLARVRAVRPSHRGTVLLVREIARVLTPERSVLGIEDIMRALPHRYPFLLVDRILEIEPKKRIVGLKNVTINEPFFQGHFPGHPIMPGVLIIEAMAQVGGVLLMGEVEGYESKVVYFMSLDNVKFRRPVKPGDQIRFEIEMTQMRGMVCKMRGIAKVDGEVVCEADMAAMVRDK
jgi:UDP-3-O-[3-hydroxymyristoyl] N-acetylglucosamine deacetylase/3-hydroxyacyl-[acyl-carrier-protein] dehydratase